MILQIPIALSHFMIVLPTFDLADRLRQLPLRQASELLLNSQNRNEPLVMVGAMKPSIHFYTNQVIVFEGRSKNAFVNVSDRLKMRREEAGKEDQYMDPMVQKLLFYLLIKDQWKNLIGKDLIQKS